MKSVWPVILLFIFLGSGEASAFPGAFFQEYFQAYGAPTNLNGISRANPPEKKIQYYWEGAAPDLFSTGQKLKGNLIVLFEDFETSLPFSQREENSGLRSLQETFLTEISDREFEAVLKKGGEKWKLVAKTTHKSSDRVYDLYEMVSRDNRFLAEMSHSSLETIPPVQNGSAVPQVPLINLWIRLTPNH